MKYFKTLLLIILATAISACGNGDLSRSKVIKLMDEYDHKSVIVTHYLSKDGKAGEETEIGTRYLAEEFVNYHFIKRTTKNWRTVRVSAEMIIKPTPKLANAIYSYKRIRWENHDGSLAGVAIEELKAHIGDVSSMEVKGIKSAPDDLNKRVAEIELTVSTNEVGEEFYGKELQFPILVEFILYDDGWRYEKVLWDESKQKSSFVKNEIAAFATPVRTMNSVLWNMHKLGNYSDTWESLASKLEKSDKYNDIDTAAWAYHDNGNIEKGLSLYENKVMPKVRDQGDPNVIESFSRYFESMKNAQPLLEVLARNEESRLEELRAWQQSTEAAKQERERERQAKIEKDAAKKVEREKQRRLAEEKREAERKEAERIANLKRLSKISGNTLGQFSCLGKKPGEFSSKPKNFKVTDVAIKQTAEDKKLCFGYGTESTLYFVDMRGSPVVEPCYKRETDSSCLKFFNQNGKQVFGNDIEFPSVSEGKRFFSTFKPALDLSLIHI